MMASKNLAARAVLFLVKNFDVVSQTTSLNLEISRCHLAAYVKELYQCVPHVQHDYLYSFNQSDHCFLASSLQLPSSLLKTP